MYLHRNLRPLLVGLLFRCTFGGVDGVTEVMVDGAEIAILHDIQERIKALDHTRPMRPQVHALIRSHPTLMGEGCDMGDITCFSNALSGGQRPRDASDDSLTWCARDLGVAFVVAGHAWPEVVNNLIIN